MNAASSPRRRPSPLPLFACSKPALLALVLVSSACASLRGAHPVDINADEPVKVIVVGERLDMAASYLRFFPRSIELRPGDGIRFTNWAVGEPHALAFGTVVDDAARAVAALGDRPEPTDVARLPEVMRLPSPLEPASPGGSLPFAERCFVTTAPADGGLSCESDDLPEVDGRSAFWSSGLLDSGEIITARLSEDIEPGTYAFVDLVHPEVMWGQLTVVAAGEDRPEPGDALDRGEDEWEASYRTLGGASLFAAGANARTAMAGVPSEAGFDYLATFGVEDYRIAPDETITWQLFGIHSVTFEPPGDARRGLTVDDAGAVRLNAAAWEPTSRLERAAPEPARDGVSEITALDGGAWDGVGSISSGIIRSFPPQLVSYSLTFTQPGEYDYVCLVHPKMKGTVMVEDES